MKGSAWGKVLKELNERPPRFQKEKLNYNPDKCPCCGKETLITTKVIAPERGPPLKTNA